EELVPTPNGFAVTSPIPPGRREVSFSYVLPYEGKDLLLNRAVSYPTDRLIVLLPETGVGIQSGSLAVLPSVALEDRRYAMLRGESLPAGTTVDVRLSNLPQPGGVSWWERGRWPLLALMVAAVVVLALVYQRRRAWGPLGVQGERAVPGGHADRPSTLAPAELEKEQLLRALAEIERRHEAGDLSDEGYGRLSSQVRKRLEEIW
ncbi:MAG TPA: hypothetical protein VJM69_01610, partial [Dehalococcoidia bacterium]|nr:hypothetical protein [Dehalococcoidia bacterium]